MSCQKFWQLTLEKLIAPAVPSSSQLIEVNFNSTHQHHNNSSNNINCLSRSNTFSSGAGKTGPGRVSPRRKLPQIPPRAVSVTNNDNIFTSSDTKETDSRTRARSLCRDINLLNKNQSRTHSQGGYFYNFDEEKYSLNDSGYPSYAGYGEETCVDSPSATELLPKRNSSNFLWVDFNEKDKNVVRRPKNHDRLTNARKSSNRHSAPPGTELSFISQGVRLFWALLFPFLRDMSY